MKALIKLLLLVILVYGGYLIYKNHQLEFKAAKVWLKQKMGDK